MSAEARPGSAYSCSGVYPVIAVDAGLTYSKPGSGEEGEPKDEVACVLGEKPKALLARAECIAGEVAVCNVLHDTQYA